MGETGEEEILRVGRSRTHRGFRYLTEGRRTVENLCQMGAFPLLTLLTKQLNPVGHVRVRILEVFYHHRPRHPG